MSFSKIIKIQNEILDIMEQNNIDFNILIDKVNSKLNGIYAYYAVETNEGNITEIYRYTLEEAFKIYCKHTVSDCIKPIDKWSWFNWYYYIVEPYSFNLD